MDSEHFFPNLGYISALIQPWHYYFIHNQGHIVHNLKYSNLFKPYGSIHA